MATPWLAGGIQEDSAKMIIGARQQILASISGITASDIQSFQFQPMVLLIFQALLMIAVLSVMTTVTVTFASQIQR